MATYGQPIPRKATECGRIETDDDDCIIAYSWYRRTGSGPQWAIMVFRGDDVYRKRITSPRAWAKYLADIEETVKEHIATGRVTQVTGCFV